MKHVQRYMWLHCLDPHKLLAEYDEALANIEADVSTAERTIIGRVRRLPDAWRLLWYAVVDGASADMIARKFGLPLGVAKRRMHWVRNHVANGCKIPETKLAKRIDNIL